MKNTRNFSLVGLILILIVSIKYFNEIKINGFLWFLIFTMFLILVKIILSFLNLKEKTNQKLKFPKFNNLLSYHILWSILLEGPFNGVIIFLFIKLNLLSFEDKSTLLILFPIALTSRFFYTNNIIRILKLFANLNYSITVFRRFEESNYLRTEILPIIGAYGKIFSIGDYTLDSSKKNINGDSATILTEINEYVICDESNWKNIIRKYLRFTNLIIFNWSCLPTNNMIWELKETLKINQKKILFVLSVDTYMDLNIESIFKTNNINSFEYDIIFFNEHSFRKDFYTFIKRIQT